MNRDREEDGGGQVSSRSRQRERPRKQHVGVIVPMVTPLTHEGRIDRGAAERIADRLIEGGCHPFVLGTTGEGASFAPDEAAELIACVASRTAGRARLYAGVSTNALRTAVDMGRRALDLGADAVVAHPPCYFRIGGEGMLRYFEKLAETLAGPLLLYNMPATTNLSIPLEVVERLSHHPHIVGLKDSEANRRRLEESVRRWSGRGDFVHLVGSAPDGAYGLELGSDGIVPSAGNLVPRLYHRLYEAAILGDSEEAFRLQRVAEEFSSLYAADRPLPESLAALKTMMAVWEICEPHMGPPLSRLAPAAEHALRSRLSEFDRARLEAGAPEPKRAA
jgi:dihydrodipicolinate synthase/N-acetylneuraminate lyase